jgi:predicted DNA-binding transcriptional regulator YafY
VSKLPETTRVSRILEIIWNITRAPRQLTRRQLAERFQVSERTITNDLAIIEHGLRFELGNERGKGYYFKSVPQLPAVTYSLSEALALVLAAQSGRRMGGIPHADLSSAIARLSSVFPPEMRSLVERLDAGESGASYQHREAMLAVCSQAVSQMRAVELVYAAASRNGVESSRRVDAYAVVPYVKSWHLIGYCHLRQDMRTFKLDRIREITELDVSFTPRDDFDLEEYLAAGWGLMRGMSEPAERVELLFDPNAGRWVAEEVWHSSQHLEWLDDGRLRFRVHIQITPEFQRWVFRYGSHVHVVTPESLRAWVREEAQALLCQS